MPRQVLGEEQKKEQPCSPREPPENLTRSSEDRLLELLRLSQEFLGMMGQILWKGPGEENRRPVLVAQGQML